MNNAFKLSTNIFLSRLSNVIGPYSLFIITGYVNSNALGEFNIFLSFINIFDVIATTTFVYFQNKSSRNKSDNLLFTKGLQVAVFFGIVVTILASIVSCFSFSNSPLLLPILLTAITYPILSSISFISYYFEGVNKSNLTSKTHIIVSLFEFFLFFILLKLNIYIALAASIAFLVKDVFTLWGLLARSGESIVFIKNLLSWEDICHLLQKGLPMSFGTTIARYINSLIVITIGLFGVSASNLYAVSTRTVAIFLLPSIAISQSLSIYYGSTDNKTKEAMNCVKLHAIYTIFILSLIFLALPEIFKVIFNYAINPKQIFDTKLAVIIWFLSCFLSTISIPVARAINFIKIPQTVNCLGVFIGLVIGKFLASDMFDFVYIVSITNGLAALTTLILTLWLKTSQIQKY